MLTMLYLDDQIAVCVKPPRVLSTDEPGGMPDLVRQTLGNPWADVRTVHRLDRVVGGVMVLARNAAAASELLPTVRSRCVAWKMNEAEELAEDPQAMELCRRLADGDLTELTAFTVSLENRRMKRERLQEMFRCAWRMAAEALLLQCGKTGTEAPGAECAALLSRHLPRRALQKLTELLKYYAGECDYNVGAGHVLGAFTAECEGLLRKK